MPSEAAIKYFHELWLLMTQIALVVTLLPLMTALKHPKTLNKPLKIFIYYLVTKLILSLGEQIVYWMMTRRPELIESFLKFFELKSFNFYNIFFNLMDLAFLGTFFYHLLRPLAIAKWALYISYSLIIIILSNFLFIEGPDAYRSFNSTTLALYNFILPIFFMWIIYNADSKVPLHKNPYFWINLGLIVPNLLSLFLYFAGDKISNSDYLLYVKIMIGRSIIEMISLLLFTIGFSYGRYAQFLRQ